VQVSFSLLVLHGQLIFRPIPILPPSVPCWPPAGWEVEMKNGLILVLPVELRLQIYHYVFDDFALSAINTRPGEPRRIRPFDENSANAFSICRVNRRIRAEALPVLKLRANGQSRSIALYYACGPGSHTASQIPRWKLTPELAHSVQLMVLPYGGGSGYKPCLQLSNLKAIGSCCIIQLDGPVPGQSINYDDLASFRTSVMAFLNASVKFRRLNRGRMAYYLSAFRGKSIEDSIWLQLRFKVELKHLPIEFSSQSCCSSRTIPQAVWIRYFFYKPGAFVWCRPTLCHHAGGSPLKQLKEGPFYNPPLE
jgi:hypothetical protein